MKKTTIKTNKRKLVARVMLLVLLLTSALNLGACGKKGLEAGFEQQGHLPKFMCAYRSDNTDFDINDVTLTFYYGGSFWDYSEKGTKLDYSEGLECSSFELRFENDKGDVYSIKKVEENFISDKYNITWEHKIYNFLLFEYIDMTPIFSHKETITIPKELFVDESGWISFGIYSNEYVYTFDREYIEEILGYDDYLVTRIGILYKKVGNRIILSKEGL